MTKKLRTPGIEPGAQAWEACMLPLHYVRFCRKNGILAVDPSLRLFFLLRISTKIQHPRIELGTFRVLGGRHNH